MPQEIVQKTQNFSKNVKSWLAYCKKQYGPCEHYDNHHHVLRKNEAFDKRLQKIDELLTQRELTPEELATLTVHQYEAVRALPLNILTTNLHPNRRIMVAFTLSALQEDEIDCEQLSKAAGFGQQAGEIQQRSEKEKMVFSHMDAAEDIDGMWSLIRHSVSESLRTEDERIEAELTELSENRRRLDQLMRELRTEWEEVLTISRHLRSIKQPHGYTEDELKDFHKLHSKQTEIVRTKITHCCNIEYHFLEALREKGVSKDTISFVSSRLKPQEESLDTDYKLHTVLSTYTMKETEFGLTPLDPLPDMDEAVGQKHEQMLSRVDEMYRKIEAISSPQTSPAADGLPPVQPVTDIIPELTDKWYLLSQNDPEKEIGKPDLTNLCISQMWEALEQTNQDKKETLIDLHTQWDELLKKSRKLKLRLNSKKPEDYSDKDKEDLEEIRRKEFEITITRLDGTYNIETNFLDLLERSGIRIQDIRKTAAFLESSQEEQLKFDPTTVFQKKVLSQTKTEGRQYRASTGNVRTALLLPTTVRVTMETASFPTDGTYKKPRWFSIKDWFSIKAGREQAYKTAQTIHDALLFSSVQYAIIDETGNNHDLTDDFTPEQYIAKLEESLVALSLADKELKTELQSEIPTHGIIGFFLCRFDWIRRRVFSVHYQMIEDYKREAENIKSKFCDRQFQSLQTAAQTLKQWLYLNKYTTDVDAINASYKRMLAQKKPDELEQQIKASGLETALEVEVTDEEMEELRASLLSQLPEQPLVVTAMPKRRNPTNSSLNPFEDEKDILDSSVEQRALESAQEIFSEHSPKKQVDQEDVDSHEQSDTSTTPSTNPFEDLEDGDAITDATLEPTTAVDPIILASPDKQEHEDSAEQPIPDEEAEMVTLVVVPKPKQTTAVVLETLSVREQPAIACSEALTHYIDTTRSHLVDLCSGLCDSTTALSLSTSAIKPEELAIIRELRQREHDTLRLQLALKFSQIELERKLTQLNEEYLRQTIQYLRTIQHEDLLLFVRDKIDESNLGQLRQEILLTKDVQEELQRELSEVEQQIASAEREFEDKLLTLEERRRQAFRHIRQKMITDTNPLTDEYIKKCTSTSPRKKGPRSRCGAGCDGCRIERALRRSKSPDPQIMESLKKLIRLERERQQRESAITARSEMKLETVVMSPDELSKFCDSRMQGLGFCERYMREIGKKKKPCVWSHGQCKPQGSGVSTRLVEVPT